MARIDFGLDPRKAPRIHDRPSDEPAGWRYAWIDLTDRDGSEITMKIGGGLIADHMIVETIEPLMLALEQMRDAALDRIKDREWIAAAQAQRASCRTAKCTLPAGHEPLPDGALHELRDPVGAIAGLTPDEGDHFVRTPA